MLRRQFLAAAGAAVAPAFVGAANKSGSALPRVGTGEHTYEVRNDFFKKPDSIEWQTTHNVAVDADGLIYITHEGDRSKRKKGLDPVVVFDHKGKFVRSFGKDWHGAGHGIDVRRENNEDYLYHCNPWLDHHKVVKTTLTGEMVWKLERPECPEYADPKKPYSPTNISFNPDGGFTVGDGYGSHHMLVYSADRKLLKVYGSQGHGDGQFVTPHGNWTDLRDPANPKTIVCDRANGRLQTFTIDGKFLSKTEKGTVLFPANVDIRGDVLMCADVFSRISLFDKAGKPIVNLGDDQAWRENVQKKNIRANSQLWENGKFVTPHDACFDAAGNILVAEWVEGGRLIHLKKVG